MVAWSAQAEDWNLTSLSLVPSTGGRAWNQISQRQHLLVRKVLLMIEFRKETEQTGEKRSHTYQQQ